MCSPISPPISSRSSLSPLHPVRSSICSRQQLLQPVAILQIHRLQPISPPIPFGSFLSPSHHSRCMKATGNQTWWKEWWQYWKWEQQSPDEKGFCSGAEGWWEDDDNGLVSTRISEGNRDSRERVRYCESSTLDMDGRLHAEEGPEEIGAGKMTSRFAGKLTLQKRRRLLQVLSDVHPTRSHAWPSRRRLGR